MSKLVDNLGISKLWGGQMASEDYVLVSELEAALEKMPKLYGQHFDETFKFSGMLENLSFITKIFHKVGFFSYE